MSSCFFVLILTRYLPCLSIETEKSTYLILGTLLESTESRVVGWLSALLPPIGWTLLYIGAQTFIPLMLIPYVGIGFILLHGVIGIFRSFAD